MRRTCRYGVLAVAASLLLHSLQISTAAQEADLRTRVEQLEQEFRVLKRQLELDREPQAEKAKSAPTVSIGADGFTAKSADSNFVLRIKGTLQGDGRFYPGN